jgi:hypothetical protein
MGDDKDFLGSIDVIERGISNSLEISSMDEKELCEVYEKIKKPLEAVLPYIEKIPGFGSAVASAIRILMAIANSACKM